MKNLFLILSLFALFVLTACGNDNNDAKKEEPAPDAEEPSENTGNPVDKSISLDILFIGNSLTNGFIEPALSYNQSAISDKYGSYLAAAVFYSKLLADDPRHIETGNSSASAGLGISEGQAKSLHESAYKAVEDHK